MKLRDGGIIAVAILIGMFATTCIFKKMENCVKAKVAAQEQLQKQSK